MRRIIDRQLQNALEQVARPAAQHAPTTNHYNAPIGSPLTRAPRPPKCLAHRSEAHRRPRRSQRGTFHVRASQRFLRAARKTGDRWKFAEPAVLPLPPPPAPISLLILTDPPPA